MSKYISKLRIASVVMAVLAAVTVRADWTLAKGNSDNLKTTMTDGEGHTLKVTVISKADRTLRLGQRTMNDTNFAKSDATNGDSNGWELNFSQPIRLSGAAADETWTIVEIGNSAFANNKVITNPATGLDLSTVTNIAPAAFMYCNKLTKVILSPNLKRVGISAFNGASSITDYGTQFPDSLEEVGAGAFGRHYEYDDASSFNPKLAGDITLLGATSIGGAVFAGAGNVTSLTIGENLASITASGAATIDKNVVIKEHITELKSDASEKGTLRARDVADSVADQFVEKNFKAKCRTPPSAAVVSNLKRALLLCAANSLDGNAVMRGEEAVKKLTKDLNNSFNLKIAVEGNDVSACQLKLAG